MTKPLASFDDFMREHIANRRIERQTGGLGYWAAVDFKDAKEKQRQAKDRRVPK